MLNALVLADGAAEHHTLVGVGGGLAQRRAAQAHGLDAEQGPLRVQAGQQILEPLAFLADQILGRDLQVLDEEHVTFDGLATHLRDRLGVDPGAVEVGVEKAQALHRLGDLILGRRAGDDQDLVGPLGHGRPDFSTGDPVAVAVLLGPGLQAGGVQPAVGLGDRETGLVLAGDDARQVALLLFVRAELHHRHQAEDVEVDGAGAGEAGSGLGHHLHDVAGLGEAKARAAVRLRHGHPQPAAGRHGGGEGLGEVAGLVGPAPVLVVEVGADAAHGLANGFLFLGRPEAGHARYPCCLSNRRGSSRAANGPGSSPAT